jgi:S-adenosylmethionine synthetase
MARYVAKNIVKAGLAPRCKVQLAYAIGVPRPVSFMIDTCGAGKEQELVAASNRIFNFKPGAIIRDLELMRPIYRKTACYGHFGREEPSFTWERTDRATALKEALDGAKSLR